MRKFAFVFILFLIVSGYSSGCIATEGEDFGIYPDKLPLSPQVTHKPVVRSKLDTAPSIKDGSLTIDQAISLAIKYNPQLAANHKEIRMAEARIIQAKLWPNPTIELEAENIPSDNFGFNKSENVISIEQEISLGGKISARKKVAQKEKEIVLFQYEIALRQVIAEVKKAFNHILVAQRRLELLEETKQIAQNLFELTQKRVEARAALENELIRARLELTRADIKLANARATLTLARKKLNTAIGVKELKVETYNGLLKDSYLLPSEESLKTIVYTTHPELTMRQKGKQLAQAQLKLAQSERYPNIGVRFGYGRNELEEESLTELGVSIPLPIFNRNQGAILKARISMLKAQEEHQAAANTIIFQLDETLMELKQAINQVQEYKNKILPDAAKSLELVRTGYQHGKFSYLDLLEAQRTLAETQEVYLEIIELLNNKAVNLEKLTGTPLESKK